MSLDVTLVGGDFDGNITHNLGKMADAAGIYKHIWRPEEIEITKAGQLIQPLTEGLVKLADNPEYYMQFNALNGWGKYSDLVSFVSNYLADCARYPDATIHVWR